MSNFTPPSAVLVYEAAPGHPAPAERLVKLAHCGVPIDSPPSTGTQMQSESAKQGRKDLLSLFFGVEYEIHRSEISHQFDPTAP